MSVGNWKTILAIQVVLTVIGTVFAVYNFATTITSGLTILSFLFAVSYLASFVALIVYATTSFKNASNLPYQITVYFYAALLGIQILQNGQFMASLGLDANLTLFIGAANLTAFANVVKFTSLFDDRKRAFAYLLIAVVLKLVAELVLIVLFIGQVNVVQVLMSLSVPLLGATLLVAYLARVDRQVSNA